MTRAPMDAALQIADGSDRHYYALRWSEEWMKSTLDYFHSKWRLDMGRDHPHYDWVWRRRHLMYRQYPRRAKAAVLRALGRG